MHRQQLVTKEQVVKNISSFSLSLSLVAVLVTSFAPLQAANPPSSASVEVSAPQLVNLKLHQKRFAAYHDRMSAAGSAGSLSDEFLAVHDGLRNGQYMYDVDTVSKVFQEVYADMMPLASPRLHEHVKSLAPLAETEIQSNQEQYQEQ